MRSRSTVRPLRLAQCPCAGFACKYDIPLGGMRRAFVREAPHSRTKLNVESMRRAFRVALPFDTQQECRHERERMCNIAVLSNLIQDEGGI